MEILAGLETALAARSRIDVGLLFMRDAYASRHHQPVRAPAGRYLAVPVGVTTAAPPDSDLADISLLTLAIAPDRAALTVTGRMSGPPGRPPYQHSWPQFPGPDYPSAVDDRGNSYDFLNDSGWSKSEGIWAGVLAPPVPPAGTHWLELAMSPGSRAIRVDLTGPAAGGYAAAGVPSAGWPPYGGRPGRRIDAAAEELLRLAVADLGEGLAWYDLSSVTDIVTALDAVGALAPARDAVSRLVSLARLVGVTVPPALSAAAPPGRAAHRLGRRPGEPPSPRWPAARGRGRGGAAGTRRHEIRDRRAALDPSGAGLRVLSWGPQHTSHLLAEDIGDGWYWSARDDQGRWHIGTEGSGSSDDQHADLELELVPPLHPEATSLELILGGGLAR